MLDLNLTDLRQYVESLNYRPLFVTVSGAHLYGFPSSDSDVDLLATYAPEAHWSLLDRVRMKLELESLLPPGAIPIFLFI